MLNTASYENFNENTGTNSGNTDNANIDNQATPSESKESDQLQVSIQAETLPDTASFIYNWLFLGFVIVLASFVYLRKQRKM